VVSRIERSGACSAVALRTEVARSSAQSYHRASLARQELRAVSGRLFGVFLLGLTRVARSLVGLVRSFVRVVFGFVRGVAGFFCSVLAVIGALCGFIAATAGGESEAGNGGCEQ